MSKNEIEYHSAVYVSILFLCSSLCEKESEFTKFKLQTK